MPCCKKPNRIGEPKCNDNCIIISSDGESCICFTTNDRGDIIRCLNCKCTINKECECQCVKTTCICIPVTMKRVCIRKEAKGFKSCYYCSCETTKKSNLASNNDQQKSISLTEKDSCVCVTMNEDGKVVRCDVCACENAKGSCCSKCGQVVQDTKDKPCKTCCCNENITAGKSLDKNCVCIPTDGKSCICVCKNEDGKLTKCDDCVCDSTADSNCKCINTNCVCTQGCCSTETSGKSCSKKCDKLECICIPTGGKSCVCVCKNKDGNLTRCVDCACNITDICNCKCDKANCVGIATGVASCICVCIDEEGKIIRCNQCSCVDDTGKTSKKCDKAECICIPADGKSCVCVCKNKDGNLTRCVECACNSTNICNCKCDKANCVCIATGGASCICVCIDKEGKIHRCIQCSCVEDTGKTKKKCDKAECICIPTDGKSCVCVCKNEEGKVIRCNDCVCECFGECKCDQSSCVRIPTAGESCICVCEEEGKIKRCEKCCCIDECVASTSG